MNIYRSSFEKRWRFGLPLGHLVGAEASWLILQSGFIRGELRESEFLCPGCWLVVVSGSGRLKQLYFWLCWFDCSTRLDVC